MESLVAYPRDNDKQFPVLLVNVDLRGRTSVSGTLPSYLTIDKLKELLDALAALPGGPFFDAAFVSKDAEPISVRAKVEGGPTPRVGVEDGIDLNLAFEGEEPRPAKPKVKRAPKPSRVFLDE